MTPPASAPAFAKHDPLGRCYTPQALADRIVEAIAFPGIPWSILEPSVGGGAFVVACARRWPESRVIGIDKDPDAEGLRLCDTAHVADFVAEPRPLIGAPLVLGNPDFGRRNCRIPLAHTEAALALGPVTLAFILPWAFWGVETWRPLLHGERRPAVVRPIPGRPWDCVREVAVYEWHRGFTGKTQIEPIGEWR